MQGICQDKKNAPQNIRGKIYLVGEITVMGKVADFMGANLLPAYMTGRCRNVQHSILQDFIKGNLDAEEVSSPPLTVHPLMLLEPVDSADFFNLH